MLRTPLPRRTRVWQPGGARFVTSNPIDPELSRYPCPCTVSCRGKSGIRALSGDLRHIQRSRRRCCCPTKRRDTQGRERAAAAAIGQFHDPGFRIPDAVKSGRDQFARVDFPGHGDGGERNSRDWDQRRLRHFCRRARSAVLRLDERKGRPRRLMYRGKLPWRLPCGFSPGGDEGGRFGHQPAIHRRRAHRLRHVGSNGPGQRGALFVSAAMHRRNTSGRAFYHALGV